MEELDPKNISVIRQKLATLKPAPNQTHYEYYVGNFKINIWLDKIQEHAASFSEKILDHATVNIDVFEISNRDNQLYDWVYLDRDSRFTDYEPIQYSYLPGRYQKKTSGQDMPILQLCELIKYLYRLSNLNAFM